jgi:hypothetical protein
MSEVKDNQLISKQNAVSKTNSFNTIKYLNNQIHQAALTYGENHIFVTAHLSEPMIRALISAGYQVGGIVPDKNSMKFGRYISWEE